MMYDRPKIDNYSKKLAMGLEGDVHSRLYINKKAKIDSPVP